MIPVVCWHDIPLPRNDCSSLNIFGVGCAYRSAGRDGIYQTIVWLPGFINRKATLCSSGIAAHVSCTFQEQILSDFRVRRYAPISVLDCRIAGIGQVVHIFESSDSFIHCIVASPSGKAMIVSSISYKLLYNIVPVRHRCLILYCFTDQSIETDFLL